MGKRKSQKKAEPVEGAVLEEAPRQALSAYWPEEYCSPRRAKFISCGVFVGGIMLFSLAAFDKLAWVKVFIGWYIGLSNPLVVSPGSWDVAMVGWGLLVLAGAAVVHPSLGIGVLALFRPWLDGYTYPGDNVYFLWAILLMNALWAARLLLRGGRIRISVPLILFAAFYLVALVTSAGSIQAARTYRELMLWFGYFFLFFLTSNSLRSRMAFGVVLGGVAVSMLIETCYGIVQFEYLLPCLRRALMEDPAIRIKYFGTDAFTPELVRRFNINRAYGSMLFPNALAGFLILGIPYAMIGARLGWGRLWRAVKDSGGWGVKSKDQSNRYRAVALGGGAWLLGTLATFVCLVLVKTYQVEDSALDAVLFEAGSIAGVAGLLPAVLVFWLIDTHGVVFCGVSLRALGLTALALFQCWALWVTYTRGAMLSLLAAGAIGVGIWRVNEASLRHWARRFALPVLGLAVLLGVIVLAGVVVHAHSGPKASGAEHGVVEEGVDLTAKDLLDPASLGLRFTYWRVGLTMFRHSLATGVGLGNFGLAYPRYQYIGAGNVRLAHNGYLQMFCETGILGGLLFSALWAYILIWGAWRVFREPDRGERLLLLGLYLGIFAFLGHAFIDIHFSHPSLAMFLMVMCGLFLARAHRGDTEAVSAPSEARSRWRQLAAVPILIAVALGMGMSLREYFQNLGLSRVSLLDVANDDELARRYRICNILVVDSNGYGFNRSLPRPSVPVRALQQMAPDLSRFNDLGVFVAADPGAPRSARKLEPGEEMPANAYFIVTRPYLVRDEGVKIAEDWLNEISRLDAWFPYTPELAVYAANLSQTLIQGLGGKKQEAMWRQYRVLMMHWIEEAVRRSPTHADVHLTYGRLLWFKAGLEEGSGQSATYRQAIEEFRLSSALNPTMPEPLAKYGESLQEFGTALRGLGQLAEAERYAAQAAEVQQQVEALRAARRAHGMD